MNFQMRRRTSFLSTVAVGLSLMLFSTSCGGSKKNMKIPGINGPTLNLVADNLLVSMVVKDLNLDGGLRYKIPKFPNSYLEVSPDISSGGTLVSMSLALEDILYQNVNKLDPQTLPGGRALPGVAGGTLPAVAFSIEQLKNIAFYIGPKVFGIFVPVNALNREELSSAMIVSRFYTGKIRAGNLALVGPDENLENAGVLLLLDMSSATKKKMRKRIRRYN